MDNSTKIEITNYIEYKKLLKDVNKKNRQIIKKYLSKYSDYKNKYLALEKFFNLLQKDDINIINRSPCNIILQDKDIIEDHSFPDYIENYSLPKIFNHNRIIVEVLIFNENDYDYFFEKNYSIEDYIKNYNLLVEFNNNKKYPINFIISLRIKNPTLDEILTYIFSIFSGTLFVRDVNDFDNVESITDLLFNL